ncbi:hypothetical protein [Faecalispora sporosphaeroides]|uniref:hypothetical protein n=1 Tax=Faecalispora sporosphaeroides TaxID=1549 RepID=UPI0003674CCC|nr:hypothetical protein [Faecalispora sporosphaeroides]
MNRLASAYSKINEILQKHQQHGLSSDDIIALKDAQKAILLIEMLGLSQKSDNANLT